MSLISGPGLHRLPSRQQLAADLKACHRQKDAATIAAIKYATQATELRRELEEVHAQLFGLQGLLEIAQLEGIRLQAELDNATPVTIPASWDRDIDPGDEPTHPQGLNVRTLRAQFADRPGSTSPSHIPGWAR